MPYFEILLPLAMILFFSKFFGIVLRKIGVPQVVGMLLAGLLIGCIRLIPGQHVLTEDVMEGVGFIAKIGVILIMFSAGLETDLKTVRSTGIAALSVTAGGVIVPMALGFLVACGFNGGFTDWSHDTVVSNLFYGTILTATSVSVTVATLKELGKLSSRIGTAIVSAAIIDDVIGIIVLSFVIGIGGGGQGSVWIVLAKTVAFFVAAVGVGLLIRFLFKKLAEKFPHNRRVPIFGYAVCFLYAYCAEEFFGVADITGAFIAGLMLAQLHESDYIDRKADITTYMLFGPVFFANIGMTVSFGGLSLDLALFGACFIIAGMVGKFIGCAIGAKICKFSWSDSFKAGVGMMARAEVALVCAQKGVENRLIDSAIMPFILILIIATSFLTPVLIKTIYKKDEKMLLLPIENKEGTEG